MAVATMAFDDASVATVCCGAAASVGSLVGADAVCGIGLAEALGAAAVASTAAAGFDGVCDSAVFELAAGALFMFAAPSLVEVEGAGTMGAASSLCAPAGADRGAAGSPMGAAALAGAGEDAGACAGCDAINCTTICGGG